ncbi:hypothetical protein C1645_823538 [Glomus cerebriforme]|uniref:F-box domain-containing protein n=1 Tax=Glomus cerebriforme TaxID=658196 RepID=A0A397SW91_9GLOM|nr:hypothetical protein C1645_823538 [Glomus cerebriforme]
MATTLPELCLRMIFEELRNDFISLHSCILVNRNWCNLALPKLWKNPFDAINNSNLNGIMEANIPLLNTYTSCLSEDIRDNLGLKSNIQVPLFDYGIYLQYIHFKTILKSIYLWRNLYKDCGDPTVFKLKTTTKRRKISNSNEDNVLKALCEYFINRSKCLKGVDLLDGIFLNIFEFPNASLNLSRIQEFKFEIQFNYEVVSSAAKIAKNISKLEIDLKKVPYSTLVTRINNIQELIKSQKNLKEILLSCSIMEFPSIINSLIIHAETLTHITIRNIKFENGFPLAELAEYLNLKYLKIENCKFSKGNIIKPDLKAFQKLELISIKDTYIIFEIMEILCCQAKDCLRILKLPADSTDFPRLEIICIKYCPNIKKFITSTKTSFDHIISMLNVCKNLEEIHIYEEQQDEEIFSGQMIYNLHDSNQFLKTLGEILPKSVHTFKYFSEWRFDSESLEIFLRRFQPKKFKLLEFHNCSFFSDEHLNVIIRFCGKTLKKLHISGKNNLHRMYVLERRHQFLGDLYVEKLNHKQLFVDNLMEEKFYMKL